MSMMETSLNDWEQDWVENLPHADMNDAKWVEEKTTMAKVIKTGRIS
jgi:hypothetical protein